MRDASAEEMHEARASSSGGTMPQSNPLPASGPRDVVSQLREVMAKERAETTVMLRVQLEASDKLAEKRDRGTHVIHVN